MCTIIDSKTLEKMQGCLTDDKEASGHLPWNDERFLLRFAKPGEK